MEIRELESFLQIVKYGSFSKAAEKLGYTQAAVTIQIRQLEKELGVHLFDRIGKRTMLTYEGKLFFSRAGNALQNLKDAKAELEQKGELRGRLTVGVIESVCTVLMPEVLQRFHAAYPKVSLNVTPDTPEVLLQKLVDNEIDLLYLLDRRVYDSRIRKVLEEPEDVLFVAASDSVFARRSHYTLADITKEPFILTEPGASYRFILDQYLAAQGLFIQPFLETGNTELILRLLKNGSGISFLPYYTVQEGLRRGELMQLSVDALPVHVWRQLLHHKDKWVTREMTAFIRTVSDTVSDRLQGAS